MLTPGIAQVYYGDEIARDLTIEGTQGDATLRSAMDWNSITTAESSEVLEHWQKLGQFRANNPSVGAGVHKMLSSTPYTFSRHYSKDAYTDHTIVSLDAPIGKKVIALDSAFAKAETLKDSYSNQIVTVTSGKVTIDSPYSIVLLEKVD